MREFPITCTRNIAIAGSNELDGETLLRSLRNAGHPAPALGNLPDTATFVWNGHRMHAVAAPRQLGMADDLERLLRVTDALVGVFGSGPVDLSTVALWRSAEHLGVARLALLDTDPSDPLPGFLGNHAVVLGTGLAPLERLTEVDTQVAERLASRGPLTGQEIAAAMRRGTVLGRLVPILVGRPQPGLGLEALLDAIVAWLPSPADVPPVAGTTGGVPSERKCADDEAFAARTVTILEAPPASPVAILRVYSGELRSGETVLDAARGRRQRISGLLALDGSPLRAARSGDICAAVGLRDLTPGATLCEEAAPIVLEAPRGPGPLVARALSANDPRLLADALGRLVASDPGLGTDGTRLSGTDEAHLDRALHQLRQDLRLEAGRPEVVYREAPTQPAEGEHQLAAASRGQFARVAVRVAPAPRGSGVEIIDRTGDTLPREFVPACRRGLESQLARGVLAGYPVTDALVTLSAARHHAVDSTAAAFELAAARALETALRDSHPLLLEPLMQVDLLVRAADLATALSELHARRARILELAELPEGSSVIAETPLAHLFGYLAELQGRDTSCSLRFARNEVVPTQLAEGILARARAA